MALFDAYPHTIGGATQVLLGLAVRARAAGWRPTVHLIGEGEATADAFREADVPIVRHLPVGALRGYGGEVHKGARGAAATAAALPLTWARIARSVRGVDVAHVHDHRGIVLAGPGLRLARIPTVWHVHALPRDPRLVHLNRAVRPFARRIVLTSDWLRPAMRGSDERRLVVVHNGLPDSRLAACRAHPWTPPEGPPSIVTVGRLHHVKGHDVLIDAVALLRAQGLDVATRIVGPGQDGAERWPVELADRAKAAGVDDLVELVGALTNPAPAVAAASLYVHPARLEFGQALSVLEAFAQGAPVVSTAEGATADVLDHDRNALVVPVDDPPALAAAIADLLRDPARAARLGAEGPRTIEADATMDVMAERVLAVWEDAMAHARPVRR